MRRLKHPKNVLFFNSLTRDDVGGYVDAKLGKAILSFKKAGINLPGAPNLTAVGTALATGLKCSKSYTDDGYKKGSLIEIVATAKAEDVDYGYGITIRKKVKTPGVNNFQTNTYQKTYGGNLPIVTTSGGYLVAADIKKIQDNLTDFIHQDSALHSQNEDPITNFAGPIVSVKQAYLVTINLAATDTITITPDASTGDAAETIDLDGGITMITAVKDFNDDNSYGLLAMAISTTQMLIIGPAGYKFVLTDGGGNTTVVIGKKYLLLESLYDDVQFDAIFQPGFAIQQGYYHFVINTNADDSAAIQGLVGVYNGTKATATDSETITNLAAEIITDGATTVYATVRGTGADTTDRIIDVVGLGILLGTTSLDFIDGVGTCTVTSGVTAQGKYPSLTSDEVFRAVAQMQGHGALTRFTYAAQPTSGGVYAKYTIKCEFPDYEHHGASQNEVYENEVVIYMLKTAAQTDLWDATDLYYQRSTDTNSGALDTNFEELLGLWSDLAVSSW